MIDDAELLRRFADEKSQAAFAELVRRHVDFVHSAVLRRVGGDAHAAADVTQQVFTVLARRARTLARGVVLPAWLYATTRNVAVDFVRAERRRRAREWEAHSMNETNTPAAPEWSALRPLLDDAMDELNERDRELVLLRFFARRPLAEIGRALNLTEDAVRMRVNRALDKLHALLARRGFTSSAALVAAALEAHAISSAPAGLAVSVSGAAAGVSVGAATTTVWFGWMSKATLPLACSVAVGLIVGTAAVHDNASARDAQNATDARRAEVGVESLQPATVSVTFAPSAPAAPDDDVARGRAFLAAHPEMEAAFAWSRTRMFEHNWGRHLRRLNLSAGDYAAIRDEVMRAADWTFRITATGWGSGPAASPEGASQAIKKMTARLLECLGDARAPDYKEAYAWWAVNDLVRTVVVATYDTETPLTPEQTAELIEMVGRHGRRAEVALDAPFAGATSISVHRLDWSALERALAARFSPPQIATIARVWASSVAEQRETVAKHAWMIQATDRGPVVQLPRDEPTLQAHELETTRVRLALEHGTFYREAKLTPQQIAWLESTLIDHEGRMRDIRAAERGIKIDRARAETREAVTADGRRVRVLVDPSIAALRREEDARFKTELIGALGDDGYARWQEYQAGEEKRAFVAELAGRLALTRAPLTAAQGREIAAVLAEFGYQVKVGAENNNWDAILARTKPLLSPSQFAEMEALAAVARSDVVWLRLIRLLEQQRRS